MNRQLGLVAAIVLATLLGCSHQTLQLEPRWAPLESVVEDSSQVPDAAANDPSWTVTRSPCCYVRDLAAWEQVNPPGSIQREALLAHEQVHAKRQGEAGLVVWLLLYTSREFRWREEQLGWRVEIEAFVHAGLTVNVDSLAQLLSGPNYDHMCSLQEARDFVAAVVSSSK